MNCLNKIYHYLNDNGATTPKDLATELEFSRMYINNVLKQMLEYDIIEKTVNLTDTRRTVYVIKRRKK